MEYTELYKPLLKGRELTEKTFLMWFWRSMYQGSSIILILRNYNHDLHFSLFPEFILRHCYGGILNPHISRNPQCHFRITFDQTVLSDRTSYYPSRIHSSDPCFSFIHLGKRSLNLIFMGGVCVTFFQLASTSCWQIPALQIRSFRIR